MVYSQKELEDDGILDETQVQTRRTKFYPEHKDPKKITLSGQPDNVVRIAEKKVRSRVAQELATEFNRTYGRRWRSGNNAAVLQSQYSVEQQARYTQEMQRLRGSR